jgi:hypothetical protein
MYLGHRIRAVVLPATLLCGTLVASGQSTTTVTQTVNQRNTIGVLSASPSSGLIGGQSVAFTYVLHTGGAPAATSETVQFYDGATPIMAPQIIGTLAGSNLLPYSQVDTGHGWTVTGTAPTVNAGNGTGPDGSSTTATQVVFPNTAAGTSGVQLAVPGTGYASLPITLSVWAKSAAPTTLTLALTDSPAVTASSSTTCAVTSAWQRCTLTYTFPANAGSGFAARLSSANQAAQTISLWGAQVEQATSAGPYVSTIGTARASGGQAGSVTVTDGALLAGNHSITVIYAGDANFITSTSNALSLTFAKDTPSITLAASPATTSAYGQAITFTVALAAQATGSTDVPSGTVEFFDGATSLGTATVDGGGFAALSISGSSSLSVGSHTITAVYSGEVDFNSVTSAPLSYTVTQAANAVTIGITSSRNPSVYGDTVTLTIVVASAVGATPTGTVSIVDHGVTLNTVTLDGSGTAVYSLPLFSAGIHTITVTYSGDSNYN